VTDRQTNRQTTLLGLCQSIGRIVVLRCSLIMRKRTKLLTIRSESILAREGGPREEESLFCDGKHL